MTQKAVESLLGRLVTDEEFRCRFYHEPVATCWAEALDVSSRELEAVLATDEVQVERFAKFLDPRIVRATISRGRPLGQSTKTPVDKGLAKVRAVK